MKPVTLHTSFRRACNYFNPECVLLGERSEDRARWIDRTEIQLRKVATVQAFVSCNTVRCFELATVGGHPAVCSIDHISTRFCSYSDRAEVGVVIYKTQAEAAAAFGGHIERYSADSRWSAA